MPRSVDKGRRPQSLASAPRRPPAPARAMSRPLAKDAFAIMCAARRRGRALTYDDLPPEMKEAIQDYLRHTNASLRAAVEEYFDDKSATERRHGKIGTWDVGRVTDMSRLFERRHDFDEDIGAWDTLAAGW